VVIKPDMAKYAAVGREVRRLMFGLTPLVEPLSIDEAFLDLTGTARLHGMSPALSLARLANTIASQLGITVSVGLSGNKFLAKIASDLEKPRGFSILGLGEARDFLAEKPVGFIWGVGKATQQELARGGITRIAQLQAMDKPDLMRRYGSMGARLYHLSRGEDLRTVSVDDRSKSISAETTFDTDIASLDELERILWRLAEKVSRRAKLDGLAGHTVVLKLKTRDFRIRTRNASLDEPTLLANRIYETAAPLLKREANGTAFRLIGVGITSLCRSEVVNETATLDQHAAAQARAELAMDKLRSKFGRNAIDRGLAYRKGRD